MRAEVTKTKMKTSVDIVRGAVAEFLGCWAAGGEATLSLSTKGGTATVSFNPSLGRPDAPLYPPPPPMEKKDATSPATPRHRRRRGPAQKERDRKRAACYQEARATLPSPLPHPASHIQDNVKFKLLQLLHTKF